MIEQVLYRRTVEQGYNEYCSRGLSKEEAHRVNVVMDTVASDIDDLGSGADSPFMLYPFETMHRFCLATFQREFSKGRSNSVNHGLLIEDIEYRELVKNPEQLWGFTNKNFLSRKVNHREEMFALKALEISENDELNKDYLFSEYDLCNDGYLKFLNAIYTLLSKNKAYSCGLRIDSSKDANKVMRHFGYLIMCMLPYELRDKISFCSRRVPDSIGVTIQILQEREPDKTDIVYDLSAGECFVINSAVDITNFYLNDLLTMSDAELREYFGVLAAFKTELKLSANNEAEYVISKLLKLSLAPAIFGSETAENQFAFINDVFSLPTSNTEIINSIVVRLLPFVDLNHYMETFNINFELYKKINLEEEIDRGIVAQIEDNLIQNYLCASAEEKVQLFESVFKSGNVHMEVSNILQRFVEANDIISDSMLVDEYIDLFEEFFETEWKEKLYVKIDTVFKQGDVLRKKKIWSRLCNSGNAMARFCFIYGILLDKDESFQFAIFDDLVSIYLDIIDEKESELVYTRITDVLSDGDDIFRLQILNRYKDSAELEATLWIDTYNSIDDLQKMANNIEFLKCLRYKYYHSENAAICDLYLEYVSHAPVSELENIITHYGEQRVGSECEDLLISRIVYSITRDKKKLSVAALKLLASAVKDSEVNELASYINTLYLQSYYDKCNEIYEYLETKQPRLFNCSYLNKEYLPSYDLYIASKLDMRVMNDDQLLVRTIKNLEALTYHDESFKKLTSIYQKYIEQEFGVLNNDFERYLKYKKLVEKLNKILGTQFAELNYASLKDRMQFRFWNESSIRSFDYEHCEIYKSDSEVYDLKFVNHENHVLANNISGLISSTFVDWDKVYSILLTRKFISKDSVHNQVVNDFKKKYREYGMPVSDLEYIAFNCVNKTSLEMDYMMLFDNLQKNGYSISYKSINGMNVFSYIPINRQLKTLIKKYKNYQSDSPSYDEVIRGLFFEQIAVLALLIANNVFGALVIKMSENLKTRDIFLLCNYVGYILLTMGIAIVSLWLMKRANMRKSTKYDVVVFGLLIINMLLSAVAIGLSAKFNNILICIPATVVIMIILIILNIGVGNKIGNSPKKVMRRGDDIYE